MNLKPVMQAILEDYALPLGGDHGVAHHPRSMMNNINLRWHSVRS
jgi:hypothetical protein